MTIIYTQGVALRAPNKPDWCQTPSARYFQMSKEGGMHDCHYHDFNELHLISRGKAKLLNNGRE